jgi:hypothetical protein
MLSTSNNGLARVSAPHAGFEDNIQKAKAAPHIVFLITQGFAARMMLRTGITNRLRQAGAEVTVLSPNADEPYFQEECKAQGINLRQSPGFPLGIANRFRAYRPYFMDDVLNNVARRMLHGHLFKNRPVSGFMFKVINRTMAHSEGCRQLFRGFERRVNRSETVEALLRDLKPDLLVAPSPFATQDTVYILHAKEMGIPVVCPILSWDNITTKGTLLEMPDCFISWGPIMTEEMADIYRFPKDRIYECGVPHFDIYNYKDRLIPREKLLDLFKLPPHLPYIFYGTTVEMYCPNEFQILTWLADQINKDAFANPCSLVIRPHPQMVTGMYSNDGKDLERLKKLVGPRVALDVPRIVSERLAWDLAREDMQHLASLLAGSAMCLNPSSTLCLDACMSDRPVINIGFDGWEELPYERSARQNLDFVHMAKLLAFGGVRIARSFDELRVQINAYLCNPELDHDARIASVANECGFHDGRSAERVANVLWQLARGDKVSSSRMGISGFSEGRKS